MEDPSEGDDSEHAVVPREQYCDNKTARSLRQGSDVWRHVKLLRGDHAECIKGSADRTKRSHVCIFPNSRRQRGTCFKLLRCHLNPKGSFNSTGELQHFQDYHPTSEIGQKQVQKGKTKLNGYENSLTAAETDASGQGATSKRRLVKPSGPIERFVTSATNSTKPIDIALAKAARYYLYGKHHVSKSTFDDEAFRDMLTGYFDAGGGEGRIKFLTRRGLIYYIHGDF
eukprot:Plantae.Rhodophyta-Palmaria_palmata.ctg2938.p1 GENE.Plantae.Rhodophyta-Palmaria_palmata.ctg2938~~Plantae.Rhodophyta-Palmaria_palmata.ctg2938.p1  ORF type:complete len:249 (-),score=44.32 Plantae.Rhodophyta-Palmaria_palmata.ctg2938:18-698(-)